jgi:hypothetical protein
VAPGASNCSEAEGSANPSEAAHATTTHAAAARKGHPGMELREATWLQTQSNSFNNILAKRVDDTSSTACSTRH